MRLQTDSDALPNLILAIGAANIRAILDVDTPVIAQIYFLKGAAIRESRVAYRVSAIIRVVDRICRLLNTGEFVVIVGFGAIHAPDAKDFHTTIVV